MKIVIDVKRQTTTVSALRKRLAQLLAKLDGGQEVTYEFWALLPEAKIIKQ